MKVFIAGVMQGSLEDDTVQAQDYRQMITDTILAQYPDATILDPWAIYPDGVSYGPEKAKQTLFEEIDLAGSCDILISYLPEASMGTALEMWSAYQAGAPVLCISTMIHNWVILTLSTHVYPTLDALLQFITDGGLTQVLNDQ